MLKEIDAQNLDEILEQMVLWKNTFSHSSEYQAMTEFEQDESAAVILGLGEYMYRFQGLRPNEWESEALESCCLEDFPTWMVAEPIFFESLSGVLAAFFDYLEREKHLPQAEKLKQTVLNCTEQILSRSQDPAHWSHEKFFVLTAAFEGHDLDNPEQMNNFVHSYEEQFQVFSHL